MISALALAVVLDKRNAPCLLDALVSLICHCNEIVIIGRYMAADFENANIDQKFGFHILQTFVSRRYLDLNCKKQKMWSKFVAHRSIWTKIVVKRISFESQLQSSEVLFAIDSRT